MSTFWSSCTLVIRSAEAGFGLDQYRKEMDDASAMPLPDEDHADLRSNNQNSEHSRLYVCTDVTVHKAGCCGHETAVALFIRLHDTQQPSPENAHLKQVVNGPRESATKL
jgi:hypothetical protein